jgi:hypothetical protein
MTRQRKIKIQYPACKFTITAKFVPKNKNPARRRSAFSYLCAAKGLLPDNLISPKILGLAHCQHHLNRPRFNAAENRPGKGVSPDGHGQIHDGNLRGEL